MAIELTASNVIDELDQRIRGRVAITAVQTYEEERFIRILRAVQQIPRHRNKPMYLWSRTMGLRKLDPEGREVEKIPDSDDPLGCILQIMALGSDLKKPNYIGKGLFVLCDFGPELANRETLLIRAVKELAMDIKSRHMNVFMVGPDFPTITELEKEVHPLDLALPSVPEIEAILEARIEAFKEEDIPVDVDDGTKESLIDAMAGLTEDEADTAVNVATVTNHALGAPAVPLILERKKEAIRRTAMLEYIPSEPVENFGGYQAVIDIIMGAAATFHPEAREFGVEQDKGLFLFGPPGCGKSYLMRIIAAAVKRALVRLELGAVMGEGGGIIGQAELGMKKVLQIVEPMKVVLGIDEFEKGGAIGDSKLDSGVSGRTMGIFLTWQAEQTGTMVVATANDPMALRPEQIREGRFSHKLWIGLPTPEDRQLIFGVHLRKRERDPKDFNLELLAEMSDRFSGAEIEQVVKNGLLRSWLANKGKKDLTMNDLEGGIKNITPTGKTNAEAIKDLEDLAFERFGAISLTGSGADIYSQAPGKIAGQNKPTALEMT